MFQVIVNMTDDVIGVGKRFDLQATIVLKLNIHERVDSEGNLLWTKRADSRQQSPVFRFLEDIEKAGCGYLQGFDMCGICRPDVETLHEWLKHSLFGDIC